MLILYLVFLITALYWISRILLPEMTRLPLSRTAPEPNSVDASESHRPEERIEKLETLLAEKNKTISLLQTELSVFHGQVRTFDKVKTLMDEEIHRLREQNRIFRSELGIPAPQPKENSIT
jgi:hypothetical protein